jgi:hypothetical protein
VRQLHPTKKHCQQPFTLFSSTQPLLLNLGLTSFVLNELILGNVKRSIFEKKYKKVKQFLLHLELQI